MSPEEKKAGPGENSRKPESNLQPDTRAPYWPYPPPYYYLPPYYYPPQPLPPPYPQYRPPPRDSLSLDGNGGHIAGILMLVGAVIALIIGIYFTSFGVLFTATASIFAPFYGPTGVFGWLYVVCGIFEVIVGIIGLLGALNALRRVRWSFALIASILLIFGGGIFGILALIFLILSKNEFETDWLKEDDDRLRE